ncbi:MAG TPA: hypothetical protein PKA41_00310 [Verrucomicrobiota bacterium]|nr:hypothetical protein [Verrucomicrobiota bacterium]
MNAYLFSAGFTTMKMVPTPGRGAQVVNQLQSWDNCSSAILCGGDVERAQKQFEDWLCGLHDEEQPAQVTIKRIVVTQVVDQLLTESGAQPLDWLQLANELTGETHEEGSDESDHGYWVDVHQEVPPGTAGADLETLVRLLPKDIRTGLNWSADKQFFFLVTVLTAHQQPAIPASVAGFDEQDTDGTSEEHAANKVLDGHIMALPEMRDKETAAIVQARNSVVAAWLWRKHAANTRVARNEIHISPVCAVLPVDEQEMPETTSEN